MDFVVLIRLFKSPSGKIGRKKSFIMRFFPPCFLFIFHKWRKNFTKTLFLSAAGYGRTAAGYNRAVDEDSRAACLPKLITSVASH